MEGALEGQRVVTVSPADFDSMNAANQLACQFCGSPDQLDRYQAVGGSLDGRWAVVCGACDRFDPYLLDSESGNLAV